MSFVCKPCFYQTSSKYNLDRHLLSDKHKKAVTDARGKNLSLNYKKCDFCEKTFRHASNYYRHRKTCTEVIFDIREHKNVKDEVAELRHENEKLKLEMKYQNQLAQKDLEISNYEIEKYKMEAGFHEALLNQHKELSSEIINVHKEAGASTVQGIININSGNQQNIMTKKEHMNHYFGKTLDMDTFIKNFQTKYPLTHEETRVLAENFDQSGIKSYAPGLLCYLKRNYIQQVKDITGEEIDEDDDVVMPFVASDSALRNHLEKKAEGWELVQEMDKLNRIIIVSNDYIYSHHNKYLPIGEAERIQIGNALLRKSTYSQAETIAKKKDEKEKRIKALKNKAGKG